MRFTLPTPKTCADCGDGAIFHRVTYISILLEGFLTPPKLSHPLVRWFARFVYAIERWFTPHMLDFFVRVGLATKLAEPDDDTQLLAQMSWKEAKERGIAMYEVRLFSLPRNIFMATLPNGVRFAFEGIPLPGDSDLDRVSWMDDKAELKRRFRKRGFPVAKGGDASSISEARKIYASVTPPVIAKPSQGSGSRHTVLHINDQQELERAFNVAKQVAPRVILEEELSGAVYRATVVNGVFVAALRRDQPSVVGDGVSTIQELVARENTHPKRQGPYFHHIALNEATDQELAWQGYTRDTVLAAGERAILHQKINWSVGGTTADVTDDVHPDNLALFEEVASALNASIVGIDFIIDDISRSWKEQERCGILECNSMPFFDNHHLPFEGKPRNVAAAIWDMRLG